MRKIIALTARLLCIASFVAFSTSAFAEELSLTVYNDNFALVRDVRTTNVVAGQNTIEVTDVAALLDPTSVHFKPLSGPATSLLEQNFDYDLMSSDKLLSKYIGKDIVLVDYTTGERTVVKLLSTAGGMVVDNKGTIIINPYARVELTGGSGALLLEPTLNWLVNSAGIGTVSYELSYMTSGIRWNCDYVFLLSDTEKTGDMEGWVTIDNQSGATYEDAKLQLIAGDVRRIEPVGMYRTTATFAAKEKDDSGFKEESFFEYHLYTLPRSTTIKMNQTKQISLLNAANIPTKKVYVYPGGDKVNVMVEFANEEENNLGMALPKGKIRVFKRDSAGVPQFIGEDQIDHTPRREKLRLYIGDAFDIVCEKTQVEYKDIGKGYRESWKVVVKNRKEKEAIEVVVPHQIYGDWKMISSSIPHVKKDAWTAEFVVPVKADSETELTYTFEVRWK